MKINEIINEGHQFKHDRTRTKKVGSVKCIISGHLWDRRASVPERQHITDNDISKIIGRVNHIKPQLDQMVNYDRFYLRDSSTGVELGCRFTAFSEPNPTDRTLYINTVVYNKHKRNTSTPIIEVNPVFAEQEEQEDQEQDSIKISGPSKRAQEWIEKVYALYPHTFQNNHVMVWGEGDDQEFAMFELVPSLSMRDAVEVKWFQAYPLRKGVGTRAMQRLQQLAAEDHIPLTLFPWQHGQISQAKLMKFYKSLGFKPKNPGSKNLYWGIQTQ